MVFHRRREVLSSRHGVCAHDLLARSNTTFLMCAGTPFEFDLSISPSTDEVRPHCSGDRLGTELLRARSGTIYEVGCSPRSEFSYRLPSVGARRKLRTSALRGYWCGALRSAGRTAMPTSARRSRPLSWFACLHIFEAFYERRNRGACHLSAESVD